MTQSAKTERILIKVIMDAADKGDLSRIRGATFGGDEATQRALKKYLSWR